MKEKYTGRKAHTRKTQSGRTNVRKHRMLVKTRVRSKARESGMEIDDPALSKLEHIVKMSLRRAEITAKEEGRNKIELEDMDSLRIIRFPSVKPLDEALELVDQNNLTGYEHKVSEGMATISAYYSSNNLADTKQQIEDTRNDSAFLIRQYEKEGTEWPNWFTNGMLAINKMREEIWRYDS